MNLFCDVLNISYEETHMALVFILSISVFISLLVNFFIKKTAARVLLMSLFIIIIPLWAVHSYFDGMTKAMKNERIMELTQREKQWNDFKKSKECILIIVNQKEQNGWLCNDGITYFNKYN